MQVALSMLLSVTGAAVNGCSGNSPPRRGKYCIILEKTRSSKPQKALNDKVQKSKPTVKDESEGAKTLPPTEERQNNLQNLYEAA